MRNTFRFACLALGLIAATASVAQTTTVEVPPGGLRWGIDPAVVTTDAACSGGPVGFPFGLAGGYPYMSVVNEGDVPVGGRSWLGSAPCINGSFRFAYPIDLDYRKLLPGPHTLKAQLCWSGLFSTSCFPASTPLAVMVRTDTPPPPMVLIVPKTGLWWGGESESGWGLHVSMANDRLFVATYIYDYNGRPTWAVMPEGQWDALHTTWTGDLYIPHGTMFSAYDASRYSPGTPVGRGQLRFSGEGAAQFSYLAGPDRPIVFYQFAPSGAAAGPYDGLWWGGAAQSGWGLSIAQQRDMVFATWFTYDGDGNPAWYFMPGAESGGNGHYGGKLYRSTGGPWPAQVPYDGSLTKVSPAGTLDLVFSGPDAGAMTAVVDGRRVSVPIARFAF